MSVECSECEYDLRHGHHPSCSRHVPEKPRYANQYQKTKVDGKLRDGYLMTCTVVNFQDELGLDEPVQMYVAAPDTDRLKAVLRDKFPEAEFNPALFQRVLVTTPNEGD